MDESCIHRQITHWMNIIISVACASSKDKPLKVHVAQMSLGVPGGGGGG